MNRFFAVILVAAIAAGAYHYFSSGRPPEPENASETAPARRLAPAGTVFLTEYASVKTRGGVTGLPPGTKLKVLKDKGATLLVTDGEVQTEVRSTQVTSDLDDAERLSHADLAEQERIKDQNAAAAAAAQARDNALHSAAIADLERAKAAQATPTPVTPSPTPARRNPLDEPARSTH